MRYVTKRVSKQAIIDGDGHEIHELVPESSGCPDCGERRMDWLQLDNADEVLCHTCGTRYKLESTS